MELALQLGRLDDAATNGRKALRIAVAIDDRLATLWVLVCFADLAVRLGAPERGGRIWGAVATAIATKPPPQLASLEEQSAPLTEITDPVFLAAVEDGRTQDLADVIALALDEDQTEP